MKKLLTSSLLSLRHWSTGTPFCRTTLPVEPIPGSYCLHSLVYYTVYPSVYNFRPSTRGQFSGGRWGCNSSLLPSLILSKETVLSNHMILRITMGGCLSPLCPCCSGQSLELHLGGVDRSVYGLNLDFFCFERRTGPPPSLSPRRPRDPYRRILNTTTSHVLTGVLVHIGVVSVPTVKSGTGSPGNFFLCLINN